MSDDNVVNARVLAGMEEGALMPWIRNLAPNRPLTDRATPRTDPTAWYEIRNATDADEAEVLLYDGIGGWMGVWADEFVDELAGITAPRIALRLNSPGGSVFEGVAVANALRAHPASVTVYVDGIAASIASIIALAGDKLVMRPQTQLMIHDASSLTIGNAAEMREMAGLLDRQSDNLADAYAEKAGGTRDEWRARMQAETWYTAQEAVDAGLADEVQSFRKEPAAPTPADAPAARWDLSVFRYAGRDAAPAPQAAAEPEPAPEAEVEPETTHLVVKLGDNLDEQLVTLLRRMAEPQDALSGDPVQVPAEPPAEVVHAPEPRPDEPAPEPAAVADDWAALTAHLTDPPVDDWAQHVAHLTSDTVPSSSAATA